MNEDNKNKNVFEEKNTRFGSLAYCKNSLSKKGQSELWPFSDFVQNEKLPGSKGQSAACIVINWIIAEVLDQIGIFRKILFLDSDHNSQKLQFSISMLGVFS